MAQTPNPAVTSSRRPKPMSFLRWWISEHRVAIYIILGLIVIAGVFFGIYLYNSMNHPLSKFIAASAKDFNSSFTFELEAQVDGETSMRYTGAYEAQPDQQSLKAVYDADYGDYTYTGAVFAEGDNNISGSLYDGKWRVHDCTEKVLNFFDFNTDYRSGSFDSASFLRFTELTSRYTANELSAFLKTFKSRMDGNSSLAKVEITTEDDSKTYSYDIDVAEFFRLVRDEGASIFFNALHYDAFTALYELNSKALEESECTFTFTINKDGWLTDARFSITTGGVEYAVAGKMDNFGTCEVHIDQAFFEAEVAE